MAEPPHVPRTELLMKRCKLIWRLLLISNFALGAYLFARAKKRDTMEIHRKKTQKLEKSKATAEVLPEPITDSMDSYYDEELLFLPDTMPIKVQNPIPEEEQRKIFQWMLEERRKRKPKDPLEKKQIDEQKAILKQFLRAKSVPKF
ncbi:hypothetical protein L6164_013965 [Bauhinia variegata]|uniref:Uncharacterized protein n=1 Tax=Bauhinia variegata TaxID=167791 RepID=A0ACB9NFW4_BAUVA|nr:hypothetical protein L6164_013965 [Bauhinia variegata]